MSDADTATPTFVANVDGTYEVKLTVSDGELSSTDSVVVTAAIVTEATTVRVVSIDYATEGGKKKDKHLLITVALLDDLNIAVAGASVSIDLFRDESFVASCTAPPGTAGPVRAEIWPETALRRQRERARRLAQIWASGVLLRHGPVLAERRLAGYGRLKTSADHPDLHEANEIQHFLQERLGNLLYFFQRNIASCHVGFTSMLCTGGGG